MSKLKRERDLLRYIENSGQKPFRIVREERIISEGLEYDVSVSEKRKERRKKDNTYVKKNS